MQVKVTAYQTKPIDADPIEEVTLLFDVTPQDGITIQDLQDGGADLGMELIEATYANGPKKGTHADLEALGIDPDLYHDEAAAGFDWADFERDLHGSMVDSIHDAMSGER